jgi:hypothetical protein
MISFQLANAIHVCKTYSWLSKNEIKKCGNKKCRPFANSQLAATSFKEKPFNVWIRKDIQHSYQKSVAAFMGVIFPKKLLSQ